VKGWNIGSLKEDAMKSSLSIYLSLSLVVVLSVGGSVLEAQVTPAGTPGTIRGTIISLKGQELLVASPGGEARVKVLDTTTIRGEVPVKISAITPGMYIATSAQKQTDGTLRASQINIFPEDQRGSNEGHRPQSSRPGSTMTNANVEKIEETTVQDVKGPILTLKYKGGEVKVFVPPDASVMRRLSGGRKMLKPGAQVTIQATQAADGSISASRITVDAGGI
jgi:hypothetical protein